MACSAYNSNAGKLLLNILKQVYSIIKQSNNIFIQNSFDLINKISGLDNVKNIATYDFKDLFNNINISDLSKVINALFNQHKNSLSLKENITTDFFKKLTNFILYNNFIVYNTTIFKQKIGIPQGGCASSILADLYLYYYEQHFYSNSFIIYRYIDDVIIFDISGTPFTKFPISYPKNLELIKNHNDQTSINFLDINIKINSAESLIFDLYDKRLTYPFKVNTFSHFNSCLQISVFRNIILNYQYRITNICTRFNKPKNIKLLIDNAIKNSYPLNFVKQLIKY